MSRLCIVVNDNKPYYFGLPLGDGAHILALGKFSCGICCLKRREEEIIYCLPFPGIYQAQISRQQR